MIRLLMTDERPLTFLPWFKNASFSCWAALLSALVDALSSGSSSAFSSARYGRQKRPSALPAPGPSLTSPVQVLA